MIIIEIRNKEKLMNNKRIKPINELLILNQQFIIGIIIYINISFDYL